MWFADGYSLTKWVDESDNEYEPGDDYTVTANQTLTAKFESSIDGIVMNSFSSPKVTKPVLNEK